MLAGLAIAAVLIAGNDIRAIFDKLRIAGWAIVVPVLLHLPQIAASGIGWRVLVVADSRRAILLRWVKEAVNGLLPIAQIGGDMVRVRLAATAGLSTPVAAAAGLVDIVAELAAQLLFTLIGAAWLAARGDLRPAAVVIAASLVAGALLCVAPRLGAVRLLERVVATGVPDARGLDAETRRLFGQRRRLLSSGAWHLASWLLGVPEMFAAMTVLGLHPVWREAIVIEALVQAARIGGLVVPGALGVQEGGYVLVAGLFGIAAPAALALSLVRRFRDLTLGLAGLVPWAILERKVAFARWAG